MLFANFLIYMIILLGVCSLLFYFYYTLFCVDRSFCTTPLELANYTIFRRNTWINRLRASLLSFINFFFKFVYSKIPVLKNRKTVGIIVVSFFQFFFLITLVLCWVFYNQSFIGFQYEASFFLLIDFFTFNFILPISFGVDSLSLFFLLLTGILSPIVVLCSTPLFYTKTDKAFFSFLTLVLFIQTLLVLSFCVLDFLFFFIAFESVLLPTYLLICLFGVNYRKLKASYYFVMYTLITSVTFFIFIFLIISEVGSTNFFVLKHHLFSDGKQTILWFLLFVSLAGKVPTFPFYLWLPEAHVEAPTAGSVLLAGLILKLGSFGFLRFLLPLVKLSVYYYIPFIVLIANLGILFAALSAIRIIDLKKIIAYSSVAHMNFGLLGLFSNTIFGMHGCSLLLIGHGFVSSALFLLIGFLYDRYHTRLLYYYGGMSQLMPIFSIYFLFFNLANMSFPGSVNFIAEFLTLLGAVFFTKLSCFLFLCLSMLSTVYSIWSFSRVCFGETQKHLGNFIDLSFREICLVSYLAFFSIVFGFIPNIILDSLYPFLLSLQSLT